MVSFKKIEFDLKEPPCHRCNICGEYPGLSGNEALELTWGRGSFPWYVCCACMIKITEAWNLT